MEEAALALILDRCLVALSEGSSPEDAAGRYPSHKEALLPLLEIAGMLSENAGRATGGLTPELLRLKMRLIESP